MFKLLSPLLLVAAIVTVSGCGSSNNELPQPSNAKPAQPGNAQPRVPSNVPSQGQRSMAAPPKGARFTIFAGKISGELHVERANKVRETLKTSTKMPDWYVIHETGQSMLYYGYYPTLEDPKAQQDRQKIDLMVDELGNRPFQRALLVEVNTPDPTAPPEWNLTNAKGHYTLLIAQYRNTPERKQAAVDTVREARKEGVEAYYFHGSSASLVCVGTWPQEAVLVTGEAETPRGADPSKPLMVVPSTSDPELNQRFEEIARQRNLQLVRPQSKVVDPTLEAALARFPRRAVNGMEMKRMVNGQEVYENSLVMPIPEKPEAEDVMVGPIPNQPTYSPGYRPEIPRAVDPPPPQPTQGRGRLRSIGG